MTGCVAVLGGSYDPVHRGHVALGLHLAGALGADELRVIPAGLPWQKGSLQASAEQRVEMVRLAFADAPLPVRIDCQEIARAAPTFTIDTLRALRAEYGPRTSIVFLMGADQLRRLDTWRQWRALFDYAHFCVAPRPGFALADGDVPAAVGEQFARRLATPEHIRNTPHGLTYLAQDFAVDISATQIRAALQRGDKAGSLISPVVLDYIQQHNLYKS
ncbi:MAG: nicotinate-nucleotide adenylyltransferase [Pseudomonadota bacterium]